MGQCTERSREVLWKAPKALPLGLAAEKGAGMRCHLVTCLKDEQTRATLSGQGLESVIRVLCGPHAVVIQYTINYQVAVGRVSGAEDKICYLKYGE